MRPITSLQILARATAMPTVCVSFLNPDYALDGLLQDQITSISSTSCYFDTHRDGVTTIACQNNNGALAIIALCPFIPIIPQNDAYIST